jgi:hypothetical protein
MYTVVKAGDITSLDIDTPTICTVNFDDLETAYKWIDEDRIKEGVLTDVVDILKQGKVSRVNTDGLSYTLYVPGEYD